MIKFRCEQCGQKIGVPEKLIGRHVKCPRCKHRQLVQADGPAPGSVAALLAAEKTVSDASPTEAPPQPERILRGQTLDLEDKPAEAPAEEAETPPVAKAAQSSLLALAGIDAKTASTIGAKDPNNPNAGLRAGGSAGEDVVTYKVANWPGIAAGFVAVIAGCLVAVGAPSIATLSIAGAGVILAGAGLLMGMTSKHYEQWSAIVGISFSVVALGTAYAVDVFRGPSQTVVNPPAVAISAPATAHPVDFRTPAAVLEAVVPDRARVTVNAVRIGPPELRRDIANPDRTPRLLIYLTITNMGDRPLDYLSWGPGGRIATLSAMNGVQLTPIMFPKGSLLNHPQQATVSPHGQESDVLVYAPMYPMPHLLVLDLPCGNIGSIGSMHLLLPNSVGGETK